MTFVFLAFAAAAMLISGCTAPEVQQNATNWTHVQQPPAGNQSGLQAGKCGDGTCDQIEKQNNLCPQDCANATQGAQPGNTTPGTGIDSKLCGDGVCDQVEKTKGVCPQDCNSTESTGPVTLKDRNNTFVPEKPLDFAVMVHLEGQLSVPDEAAYDRITAQIKEITDLFAKYGAKATIESEMPYANATLKWGKNNDDALHYSLSKGQGVGTHCDMNTNIASEAALESEYKYRKDTVDSIVGAENNLGCSGGWSPVDWAQASKGAGFSYLDGVVMFAYLAVPMENRPINPDTGSAYTDDEIRQTYYHDPAPPELSDRIYPRRLNDTNDLVDDGAGIVLLGGSLGEIASLYENRKNCFPNCDLTTDDAEYLMDQIDYANSIRDSSRTAMLEIHFPIYTMMQPGAKEIVEAWLAEMQQYQDEGKIEWKTMKEIYDEVNQSG